MMSGIEKIKSRHGVSFLMALLFFLTCALLGSTMLSMAQVYGKRTVAKPEREARYLAAASAMELVRGQLEACAGLWDVGSTDGMEVENGLQRQLLKEIKGFCIAYRENPYGAVRRRLWSLSLEDDGGGRWKLPQVEAAMTFRSQDFPEDAFGALEENRIPLQIETVFSLAEEEGGVMSLSAVGTVAYEEDGYMEIWWEEIWVEKPRKE